MADATSDTPEALGQLTQAAAWRVALFEAGVEANAEFEAWLAADPENAAAWQRVCGPWDLIGDSAMAPELIVARRDALERARRRQQQRLGSRWTAGGRWPRLVAGIAALALAAAIVGGYGLWRATASDDYRTALGERRAITLADGSHVTLDANTDLRVRLRRAHRQLDLVRGQARFDVAHDVHRPFTVHAGDKTVVATGTSFDVDVSGARVVVTLIQGSVSVLQDAPRTLLATAASPAPALRPIARLTPGDQLVAALVAQASPETPTPNPVLRKVNLERATAWENGQLVFDNDPLSAVVLQVGRYSPRPIRVEGPAADLRLSGVFDAGDLNTFVDAVQRVLPVIAVDTPDGGIRLRRRDPVPAAD